MAPTSRRWEPTHCARVRAARCSTTRSTWAPDPNRARGQHGANRLLLGSKAPGDELGRTLGVRRRSLRRYVTAPGAGPSSTPCASAVMLGPEWAAFEGELRAVSRQIRGVRLGCVFALRC